VKEAKYESGHHSQDHKNVSRLPNYTSLSSSVRILLTITAVAALIYMIAYHKDHVLNALPYLFLLAMLLMHLGHGGHNHAVKNHG
jgi:hypothetical protein